MNAESLGNVLPNFKYAVLCGNIVSLCVFLMYILVGQCDGYKSKNDIQFLIVLD